ncbi:hypothetical protein LguiA_018014 [Lonicera macranthoides]
MCNLADDFVLLCSLFLQLVSFNSRLSHRDSKKSVKRLKVMRLIQRRTFFIIIAISNLLLLLVSVSILPVLS